MNGTHKIYRKEILDMIRDKRTRGSAFIGPFVTVFVMLFMFGFLMDTVSKTKGQTIYFVQQPNQEVLTQAFKDSDISVKFVSSIAEAKDKIHAGTAHVVLDTHGLFDSNLGQSKPVQLDEYYDQNDESAQVMTSIVGKVVSGVNNALVKGELAKAKISTDFSEPVKLVEQKVGSTEGPGSMLIGILPYLIVLWAFYGGLGAVSEMVAGEKEKNTLETLLITPVARTEIALGKLLALATLCAVSSLTSLLALVVAFNLHLPMMKKLFSQGLGLNPSAIGLMLAVLLPTVLLFASVLLAVSTRARNVREAQSQLTILSMLFITPAMASQFIGYTEFGHSTVVGLIPVLNTATSIRQAMSGGVHPAMLALTIGENTLLAAIALVFTISLFKKEEVLMRT